MCMGYVPRFAFIARFAIGGDRGHSRIASTIAECLRELQSGHTAGTDRTNCGSGGRYVFVVAEIVVALLIQ